MKPRLLLLTLFTLTTLASNADAAIIPNTLGVGGDVVVRRNNSTENDQFLRIKNQSGDVENSSNDRIGLLKFDLSSLTEAITNSAVRLELPRGAETGHSNNTFDAGNTLFLYGVPDGAAGEDFDEATVTFANYPFLTGTGSIQDPRPVTDLTGNSINDDLAVLLDTFTFETQSSAGQLIDFQSLDLNAFLQADTNGVASFILGVSLSSVSKTAVFGSDTATEGTQLPPTLLTNRDAPVPEPTGIALLALGAASALTAPRRAA